MDRRFTEATCTEVGPLNSWTRTLNLDDAHTLLALADPGQRLEDWSKGCYAALPDLSMARRRELIRMLRDGFLDLDGDKIESGLFLSIYQDTPATGQLDLVQLQWALSHPLSLIAVERLIAPALQSGEVDIPLANVETLVAEHLATSSAESRRKTRTVLLGALEGIGVLETRGTGQHRSLRAREGAPHPIGYCCLVRRDLLERNAKGMMSLEAEESSLGARLTQCSSEYARACIDWCVERGILEERDDEVRAP